MATDINFDRLERDLEQALEADKRYWEKNDAKFRAVNQRVASYEEFKEIVNASHLKPLNKGERVTDIRAKESGVWNRGVAAGAPGAVGVPASGGSEATQPAKPPTSCQEFLRHWRSLKSPEAQAAHLLSLAPDVYSAIFASEVPFGLLGQFVSAFDAACLTPECVRPAIDILGALARCQRFRLAVEFFSPAERQAADRLMERLATPAASEADAEGGGVAADASGGPDLAKLKELYLRT